MRACPTYMSDFTYWCIFQARHPADKRKSDEFSRWWPEWHRYHRDPLSNDIVYDERILFPPHQTPCPSKYIEWSEPLQLAGPNSVSFIGPFNFQPLSASNRVRRTIHRSHWDILKEKCLESGVTPPTVGSSSSHIPPPPSKGKKRKVK